VSLKFFIITLNVEVFFWRLAFWLWESAPPSKSLRVLFWYYLTFENIRAGDLSCREVLTLTVCGDFLALRIFLQNGLATEAWAFSSLLLGVYIFIEVQISMPYKSNIIVLPD